MDNRRINRNNQFSNSNKGTTPLSLLEKKKERERIREERVKNEN